MCIGIPMQVEQVSDFHAVCRDADRRVDVDTTLVGTPQPGDWLLVFLGAAREVLSPQDANAMRDAVLAVSQVMQGSHTIDHLFADLVDREPQLPDHLQALVKENR